MRETALVVEVAAAESLVAEWRLRHDPAAIAGVPAHITILYPFRSPQRLDDEAVKQVEWIAAATAPWAFELTRVDEFPGVVWLRPEPDTPFRSLTRALCDAFPDCPPYEGQHGEPQPHLSVAMIDEPAAQASLRAAIEADVAPALPIRSEVTNLALYESDEHWAWRLVRRFALAPG